MDICQNRIPGMWRSTRCSKPAKHDPDENGVMTKCGTHCDAAKAKRKAKSEASYQAYSAEMDRKIAISKMKQEAESIISQIAHGHNDPRAICADWVQRMELLK